MTNREVIEILEDLKVDVGVSESFLFEGRAGEIISEALNLSIQALEKQEPKKPIKVRSFLTPRCPVCNCEVENVLTQMSHCDHCGQAIDWSE